MAQKRPKRLSKEDVIAIFGAFAAANPEPRGELDHTNPFQQLTVAVDTHLFRVANRTGIAPGSTPLEVELGLLKVVPERYLLHAHHWLILHGRYVCKARKPECFRCIIRQWCRFEPKTPPPKGWNEAGATAAA